VAGTGLVAQGTGQLALEQAVARLGVGEQEGEDLVKVLSAQGEGRRAKGEDEAE